MRKRNAKQGEKIYFMTTSRNGLIQMRVMSCLLI